MEIQNFIGKTFAKVFRDGESIHFEDSQGGRYEMMHEQDCCERVWIEDICGDLSDLIGSPIVKAEESSNQEGSTDVGSVTWTFYHFSTQKGTVTLRWCGQSNGFYSESVGIYRRAQERP